MRAGKTTLQTQNNISLVSKRGRSGYPFLNGEKSEDPLLTEKKVKTRF